MRRFATVNKINNKKYMDSNITISATELKNLVVEAVTEAMSRAATVQTMSSSQVCQAFHISRVTLWRWVKEGKLTPISATAGNKKLFKSEDVEKLLNAI